MEGYPMASPARSDDPFAALLQRARALAAEVLAPRAEQTDQAGGPPVDNLRALGAAGLLGLTTPARYGGREAPRGGFRPPHETTPAARRVTHLPPPPRPPSLHARAGHE